eukprot:363417-Chlamydomonas_euryale.AAC.13
MPELPAASMQRLMSSVMSLMRHFRSLSGSALAEGIKNERRAALKVWARRTLGLGHIIAARHYQAVNIGPAMKTGCPACFACCLFM